MFSVFILYYIFMNIIIFIFIINNHIFSLCTRTAQDVFALIMRQLQMQKIFASACVSVSFC